MKHVLITLFCLSLLSCQSPAPVTSSNAVYFDVKGFIEKQISVLEKAKPLVRKEVISNEESETLITKNINWSRELELFLQVDLNKPAFRQSYFVDTLSANTLSYRLRTGEHLPVQFLEVIKDEAGNPLKMKATMLDKNYLFESERILTLESKAGELVSYQIEGFQQLFIGEPKPFKISGLLQKSRL